METMIIKCFRPLSCDISTRLVLFLNYSPVLTVLPCRPDAASLYTDLKVNYSSSLERITGAANAEATGAGKPSRHNPARPMPTTRKPPGNVAW